MIQLLPKTKWNIYKMGRTNKRKLNGAYALLALLQLITFAGATVVLGIWMSQFFPKGVSIHEVLKWESVAAKFHFFTTVIFVVVVALFTIINLLIGLGIFKKSNWWANVSLSLSVLTFLFFVAGSIWFGVEATWDVFKLIDGHKFLIPGAALSLITIILQVTQKLVIEGRTPTAK